MLEATIVKRRPRLTVDAAIHVGAGERVGLFGPSGAGKSTVLSCIAGIERPDRGAILWNGADVTEQPVDRRPFGYLTQEALLFPHLTVAQNIAYGLAGAANARARLAAIADAFGLQDLWGSHPAALSGGQAQRVALARMLARTPRVVLLDEPFFGLDRIIVRELIGLLHRWSAEHECAMIVVDHQDQVLRALCPTVFVMTDGRVVQRGSWAQIADAPAAPAIEALLKPL